MKVLQVITDNDLRGAQVFARDLGVALGRLGHEIDTVAMTEGRSVASLGFPVLGSSRWAVSAQLELRRRASAADVVVAHGSATAQACTWSLGRTRTPVVYRQISDSVRWAETWSRRIRVKAYLSQMAHIVALYQGSKDVLHEYFGIPLERITVVPNGVVGSTFAEGPPPPERNDRSPRHAVYLGALAEEKGVLDLIEVASRVPELVVDVYGSGPVDERLRAGAPANLVVHGPTTDPAGVLHAADLFLFPSRWGDSMPAVLIEAGLAGVPTVATDVGAAGEIIEDQVTGRVVPVGDLDAFVGGVRAVLALEPSEVAAMAEASRKRCRERFDIEIVAKAWEAVLIRAR